MNLQDNQLLGIECGGTKTIALLADLQGNARDRLQAGPANARLLTDSQLKGVFQGIANRFPNPAAIGVGAAGVRERSDYERVAAIAASVWRNRPIEANHDLETALLACRPEWKPDVRAQVITLSGTGSCCYGKNRKDEAAKVGGWGHMLGDRGSGYDIAHRALRAVIESFDHQRKWPPLGARLLRVLQLNEPNALVDWIQSAGKAEIAALAVEVFNAAAKKDATAKAVIRETMELIAMDALSCARQLGRTSDSFQFFLAGSVLLKQSRFADALRKRILKSLPKASVQPLPRDSVWGSVELARRALANRPGVSSPDRANLKAIEHSAAACERKAADETDRDTALEQSPTEKRNPRSMDLDRMPVKDAIELMLSEDARMLKALAREKAAIEKVVHWIAASFQSGGRLFYVGAGTSGRLGILDASECPPTFGAPPEQVQAIIAGGNRAVFQAVEGAEDDFEAGARAVHFRGVASRDVVVGIAASGRTPFVLGALAEAKSVKARTVLLCFNPALILTPKTKPHLVLAPDVGPEVLTGSTRLKAGTATKLVLNMFTTLAMVQCGKAVENLMVDVQASNQKLKRRATRILATLAGCDESKARESLERAQWSIPKALKRLKRRQTP